MKKILLLACALLILLSGCAENSKSKPINGAESLPQSALPEGNTQNLNLQLVTAPEGALDIFPANGGVYYSGAENAFALSFYDEASGVNTAVCSRLECRHADETCSAHFSSSIYNIFMNPEKTKLFVSYGEVYKKGTAWNRQYIVMMDVNGSNRTELYSTGNVELKRDFAFGENEIYFMTYGVDADTREEEYSLNKLNYITGAVETVKTYPQFTKLVGAYDNYLILDIGNSSDFDYSSDMIKLDAVTAEEEIIYQYTVSGYNYNSIAYANKNLLYIIEPAAEETAKLSVKDLKTNETKILNESIINFGVHQSSYNSACFDGEYMFIRMSTPDSTETYGARNSLYAINLNDGTQTLINLKNRFNRSYQFLYATNNNYIAYLDSMEYPVPVANADGTKSTASIFMSQFGLFDKAAFLNSENKFIEIR